jgi:hypothetical protein
MNSQVGRIGRWDLPSKLDAVQEEKPPPAPSLINTAKVISRSKILLDRLK